MHVYAGFCRLPSAASNPLFTSIGDGLLDIRLILFPLITHSFWSWSRAYSFVYFAADSGLILCEVKFDTLIPSSSWETLLLSTMPITRGWGLRLWLPQISRSFDFKRPYNYIFPRSVSLIVSQLISKAYSPFIYTVPTQNSFLSYFKDKFTYYFYLPSKMQLSKLLSSFLVVGLFAAPALSDQFEDDEFQSNG